MTSTTQACIQAVRETLAKLSSVRPSARLLGRGATVQIGIGRRGAGGGVRATVAGRWDRDVARESLEALRASGDLLGVGGPRCQVHDAELHAGGDPGECRGRAVETVRVVCDSQRTQYERGAKVEREFRACQGCAEYLVATYGADEAGVIGAAGCTEES